jgi:hypothetical protein
MFLSEEDDILRKWAEHFDELLNIEFSNQNTTSQETYQVYLATDEPTPTLDEVENAIQKLKDNKTLGIDFVQAELLKKASPDFFVCEFLNVTNEMQLLKTLLLSLLYMFRALLAHHQELTKTTCSL